MPSTFLGLSTAYSGLSTYQISMNTVANNISNVQTDGYSKQVTNRVASSALRVNAKYGMQGTGVETLSITQERNLYYDEKYWNNNASVGLYDQLYEYSLQIENYFTDDDSTSGFSTILSTMFNYLETLSTNASDSSVRNQFISGAQSLATYFNQTATGLQSLQKDLNTQIKSAVDEINSIAEKISILNKQINTIEIQGGYANELRDQRALLIDELSEYVPTTVEEIQVQNSNDPDSFVGATRYIVKINGQTLVDNLEYDQIECVEREEKVNQNDASGLYDLKWVSTGNTYHVEASSSSGKLRAYMLLRDGNNNENFKASITNVNVNATGGGTITANNLTQDTLSELTLCQEGTITINGAQYDYTGFTLDDTNADGVIDSVTFDIDESETISTALVGNTLSVGFSVDYMGIPYYQAQLNQFLRNFTENFNNTESQGYYLDGDGNPQKMESFWRANSVTDSSVQYGFEDMQYNDGTLTSISYSSTDDIYYQLTALNVAVWNDSLKDSNKFATTEDPLNGVADSSIVDTLLTLKSDQVMYRGSAASDFLQCMLSDIAVDTEQAKIFATNYQDLSNTIENQRLSISGVDEDEEALDLVKFQNAYNLASKMISTFSQMYSRLILETGV